MEQTQNTRARLLIAIGALVGLGVLVVVVVAGSGSDAEPEFTEAPAECVEAWNSSQDALNTGRHNALSHGYTRVQVAYSSPDGSEVSDAPVAGGGCVVVFAASQLDPEPVAAAEVYERNSWTPLSVAGADPARLTELQSNALGAANAALAADGRISAL